ncbi:MAG: hypothetical protein ACFFD4_39200, partial [Candidatus Odinarchaeota archaeon]
MEGHNRKTLIDIAENARQEISQLKMSLKEELKVHNPIVLASVLAADLFATIDSPENPEMMQQNELEYLVGILIKEGLSAFGKHIPNERKSSDIRSMIKNLF